jgi:hypothetical protein
LYICRWFILPPGKSVETLFDVRGLKNQVYTATINSYVYRPLGLDAPTGTTVAFSPTLINIAPTLIILTQGTCSSPVSVAIAGASPIPPISDVSVVPYTKSGIYYQDPLNTNTSAITITAPSTSTNFTACATSNASIGITYVPLALGGTDELSYSTLIS